MPFSWTPFSVIRTSVAETDMSAGAAVLNYKRLAEVERAFRTLKGVDLQVRPIRHRLETRVKAHIFLSMLAYYAQWHMAEGANTTSRTTSSKERDGALRNALHLPPRSGH